MPSMNFYLAEILGLSIDVEHSICKQPNSHLMPPFPLLAGVKSHSINSPCSIVNSEYLNQFEHTQVLQNCTRFRSLFFAIATLEYAIALTAQKTDLIVLCFSIPNKYFVMMTLLLNTCAHSKCTKVVSPVLAFNSNNFWLTNIFCKLE